MWIYTTSYGGRGTGRDKFNQHIYIFYTLKEINVVSTKEQFVSIIQTNIFFINYTKDVKQTLDLEALLLQINEEGISKFN